MGSDDSTVLSKPVSDNPRKFTTEQIEAARNVSFAKLLSHIGADHRRDPDFKSRAKHSVRVLVGFNRRSYVFVFNRHKWVDAISKAETHQRSGYGAIDLVTYLTSEPFARAVEICLEADGIDLPAPPSESGQLSFPFWPIVCRSLPNELLRSALFTARNKKLPREFLRQARIAVIRDDAVLTYTGEELRQNDETVWLQLIQLAREVPPGHPVVFVAKRFCESLRWPLNSGSYDQLKECLSRLQATALSVSSKRLGGGESISMVPHFVWRDDSTGKSLREWRVTIAPELVKLFADHHNTWIEWEQRLALPVGLATWLHGYFSSHRDPLPLRFDEIVRGAGLTSSGKDARDTILRALHQLQAVGFLERFSLTKAEVVVTRAPSRHES